MLAEGKTPAEIEAIVETMLESGAGSVLVTRADAEARDAVLRVAPEAKSDRRARLAWVARAVPPARGEVAIVSGGTSDRPVVKEARVRAELLEQVEQLAGAAERAQAVPGPRFPSRPSELSRR